jgi:acyl-coenzyme A thioesterase PaaI-like protein
MAGRPRSEARRAGPRPSPRRPALHPEPLDACVICGPANPTGLRVRFRRRGEAVVGSFTPTRRHQGYRGLMSGGLLAAIFDCLHYRIAVVAGVILAVTARIEVDYRAPIPLGRPVRFEARLLERRGRVFDTRATARRHDGTVAAESRAIYVQVPAIARPGARRPG